MRPRWVPVVVLVMTTAACGGGDDGGDVSREAESTVSTTTVALGDATDDGASTTVDSTTSTSAELPPPDPDTFTGRARVVNLYIDGGGATQVVDVWGRRTFTSGPVLLADGVGFGEVSDYFGAPDGYSIDIVPAGSGADGEEIGSLFNPGSGEQSTTLWVWDGEGDQTASWLLPEADPEARSPIAPPPDAGSGLIVLNALQLIAQTEDAFASSFLVGDADAGTCLTQSDAIAPLNDDPIVGGTQATYHEYPTGTVRFTLHDWPAPAGSDPCTDPPLHGPYEATAPDRGRTWVFLYTDDGLTTVKVLEVPWG